MMDFEDFFKGLVQVALTVVIVFGVTLGSVALYRSIAADGKIEYCYTEYISPDRMPPVIRLYGFRPWRTDQLIGTFPVLGEATEAAQKMGCELGTHR